MDPDDSIWRLDTREHLREVRERWVTRDRPSSAQLRAFDDWLLDAMLDPSGAGVPDPAVDGMWTGRPGLGVIVLFGLNPDIKQISVFEVAST